MRIFRFSTLPVLLVVLMAQLALQRFSLQHVSAQLDRQLSMASAPIRSVSRQQPVSTNTPTPTVTSLRGSATQVRQVPTSSPVTTTPTASIIRPVVNATATALAQVTVTAINRLAQQSPITLASTPSNNILQAGETAVISVVSPKFQFANLTWALHSADLEDPGILSSTTESTVFYQAPDHGPGLVTISVVADTADGSGAGTVSFFVLDSEASGTEAEFAPNPGKIVFTCCDKRLQRSGCDNICRVTPGADEAQLTNEATTNFYASFSYDGEQILYSSLQQRFKIIDMSADGTEPQAIIDLPGYNLYAPTLSPDGSLIAVSVENISSRLMQIWIFTSTGERIKPLSEESTWAVDPVWTADGQSVIFGFEQDGKRAHYIADIEEPNQKALVDPDRTTSAYYDLKIGGRSDISPDDQWFVFYAGTQASATLPNSCKISSIGNREIYVMKLDGSELRPLTNGGDNVAPSFSPDGKWITFMSYRDGDSEIYAMRADGANVRQLTFNERCDWQPRWGP